MGLFDRQMELAERALPMRVTGRVAEVTGLTVVADGLPVPLGAMCEIDARGGGLSQRSDHLDAIVAALGGGGG